MNEWKIPGIPEALAFLKRCATVFKMTGVAVLILLLLIPLSMVRSVLHERLGRRNEAVADITSSWGRDQKLVGPVLIVPYRHAVKSWKERPDAGGKIEKTEVADMVTANAYFLPTNFTITGDDIIPKQLRRGIYQAVVYSGKLKFDGQFARPDFSSLRIEEKNVLWAALALGVHPVRSRLPDSGGRDNTADLLPQREDAEERREDVHRRGPAGWHLRVSIRGAPTAGLRVAAWHRRAVRRAGRSHLVDAEH